MPHHPAGGEFNHFTGHAPGLQPEDAGDAIADGQDLARLG